MEEMYMEDGEWEDQARGDGAVGGGWKRMKVRWKRG